MLISYLWCQLAYIGNDPIRGSPIEVSKQSTLTIPAEHGQAYWMAHMFLYTFVIVHQTIQVQVNHVTLDKFNPFTRVYLMVAFGILLIFQICYFRSGDFNVKMSMAVLLGLTIVC